LEVETPVEHEGYRIWSVQAVGRFLYPKLGFSSTGGVLETSYSSFGTLDYLLLLVLIYAYALSRVVGATLDLENEQVYQTHQGLIEGRRGKSYRSTAEEREMRDEERRRKTRKRKGKEQCTVKICCCRCKANDSKLQSDATP